MVQFFGNVQSIRLCHAFVLTERKRVEQHNNKHDSRCRTSRAESGQEWSPPFKKRATEGVVTNPRNHEKKIKQ
ncbi:unnamed protein product [Adineta steineri]|uniref:Uncharacterized protein n=1 Tax=Adineta steineri TaxID=433720 RepID=A0A814SH09_9BILA|nr:unnamed protein product [Adineta steineri]